MPRPEDQLRALQKRIQIPAPDTPGTILTAQNDLGVGWGNHQDQQILEGNGDPNGVLYGHPGQLYEQRSVPPALWQNQDGLTTWAAFTSGLGFHGVATDLFFSDTATTVTCNGSPTTVSMALASPPSWMDGAGITITAAGLYSIGALVVTNAAPTTAGKYVNLDMADNAGQDTLIPLTQLNAFGLTLGCNTTFAIAGADLPWTVNFIVSTEADATAKVDVTPFVQRCIA